MCRRESTEPTPAPEGGLRSAYQIPNGELTQDTVSKSTVQKVAIGLLASVLAFITLFAVPAG